MGCFFVVCLNSSLWGEERKNRGTPSEVTWKLTSDEKALIAQYPVIRVGMDPSWPPFSFLNKQGQYQGIDREILELLSRKTGLQFEFVNRSQWSEIWSSFLQKEMDLVTGVTPTEEREKEALFTKAYLRYPVSIVTRVQDSFFISPSDLVGKKVAMPRGYVTTTFLEQNHPEIRSMIFDTPVESLRAVSDGRAEATIENTVSASYLIQKEGLTNLKISGILLKDFGLHFVVHQDQKVLQKLLNRGLESISDQEIYAIISRWITVDYGPWRFWVIYYPWILSGIGFLGLIAFGVFWNNQYLRKVLAEKVVIQNELSEVVQKLNQSNEDKTSILYTVSHDLRNPIGALKLNAELMEEELHSSSVDQKIKSLHLFSKIADDMSHLVENILTISAIEEGVRKPKWVKMDLISWIRQTLVLHRISAENKGIQLKERFLIDDLKIETDPGMLREILSNLLSNAVKYTPSGGVIEVECQKKMNRVLISVHDTGPGLDAEDQSKLFKKFTKLKPISQEPSSGLGLSIVKNLVGLLKGTITCHSELGKGTCFRVEFPLDEVK